MYSLVHYNTKYSCRLPSSVAASTSHIRTFSITSIHCARKAEGESVKEVEITEIRVCTNRTCRRQGSLQILETLLGISPPYISVKSCGCLGRCGAGPNLVALPSAIMFSHCGTPARAADFMIHVCGGGGGDSTICNKCLEALALRKRAEVELEQGHLSEAETLLTQAIDLQPFGGTHVTYKARSALRLTIGNFHGALEDARQAMIIAPQYVEAYLCQGDALLAMDQYDAAEESYAMALDKDPSICRSKTFKARIEKLKRKASSISLP